MSSSSTLPLAPYSVTLRMFLVLDFFFSTPRVLHGLLVRPEAYRGTHILGCSEPRDLCLALLKHRRPPLTHRLDQNTRRHLV
eukprot:23598_5